MGKVKKIVISLFVFCLLVSSAEAEDEEAKLPLHGFLQGNYSARVSRKDTDSLESGDFLVAEERFQLETEKYSPDGNSHFFLKADFFHDAIDGKTDTELREGYINLNLDPVNFRLGRQIITWGLGDLIFINDVFPKDWSAFLSGRPLEYLKVGVDCAKIELKSEKISGELVFIPLFQPDRMPSPNLFFLFYPFPGILPTEDPPEKTIENTELALRLYRRIADIDVSVYTYRGFFRTPALQPDSLPTPSAVIFHYPDLISYGLSLQKNFLDGVTSLEIGYYDSKDDKKGIDPFIMNSHTRILIGHQRQLWTDCTLGVQYYGEYMYKYNNYKDTLPLVFYRQDKVRETATLRLTQFLDYQTWQISLFGFYGISEKDYFIIPEVKYKVNDHLWVALGGNILGGKNNMTFFGQFDGNDNIYLSTRFGF